MDTGSSSMLSSAFTKYHVSDLQENELNSILRLNSCISERGSAVEELLDYSPSYNQPSLVQTILKYPQTSIELYENEETTLAFIVRIPHLHELLQIYGSHDSSLRYVSQIFKVYEFCEAMIVKNFPTVIILIAPDIEEIVFRLLAHIVEMAKECSENIHVIMRKPVNFYVSGAKLGLYELDRSEKYLLLGYSGVQIVQPPSEPHSRQQFATGVLEGFYGRPWSLDSRLELVQFLRNWHMQMYMYAPKDDRKHRAGWRDLYSVIELNQLKSLVHACDTNDIKFIYAIAPGLDMCLSDPAEISALTAKCQQLYEIGVRNFAVLWDDIPGDLCGEDVQNFGTVGVAHAAVTNALACRLFNWLSKDGQHELQPLQFFFCPRDYCTNMAQPDVLHSPYLQMIGTGLLPQIEIFWTGPAVVSSSIRGEDLLNISHVLQRPVVIWDNLHANDYDVGHRVYMGSFQDRDLNLFQYAKAILLNPGCDFQTNFVPIRTLSIYGDCVRKNKIYDVPIAKKQAVKDWCEYLGLKVCAVSTNIWSNILYHASSCDLRSCDIYLLIDIFHLPHHIGPLAQDALAFIQAALLVTDVEGTVTGAPVQNIFENAKTSQSCLDLFARVGVSALMYFKIRWAHEFLDTAMKICDAISKLHMKLVHIHNRELVYALSPYLSTLSARVGVIKEYITWRSRQMSGDIMCPDTVVRPKALFESSRQIQPLTVYRHPFFVAGPVMGSFTDALSLLVGFDLEKNGFFAKPFDIEKLRFFFTITR